MNAREEALRFLDQLRAQTHAALGTPSVRLPPTIVKDLIDQTLREVTPEGAQDPHFRADLERLAALGAQGDVDTMMSEILAEMQDNIEKTAAQSIKDGLDVGQRPLVSHLTTGQLNAVSMRVPGGSEAYLVLFEDQMQHFAHQISHMLAWTIPCDGPADTNGKVHFKLNMRDIAERIEAVPELAEWFADIVVTYAVTSEIGLRYNPLPPGYNNFASQLDNSLQYFVLGHEYAHIVFGHLHTAASRKGILPVTEAEALVYSWRQEIDADFLGAILALQASVNYDKANRGIALMGITLFFDALDVMDRAVALLQTGDENALQLGSHPPSDLRKQRLYESLSKMAETDPFGEAMRTPFALGEIEGKIIRLLWERTRPILLDLHRRGVPAAHTWRTIPKETGDEPAPAPQSAPAPRQARRRGLRWRRSS